MRIVQLIDSLEAGGAERMAVNYANALVDKVAFSGLIATRKEGSLREQLDEKVVYKFLAKNSKIDVQAIRRLRTYILHNRVAIVHAHSSSFFTAVLLKLTLPRIKIVWHDHYGKSAFLEQRAVWALKLASRFFSGSIVVNQLLKQWVQKKLHCKEVVYLPNFTTHAKNTTAKTILKGTAGKRILCLANLRPQKNHPLLLEVALLVKTIHPDWSFHLVGHDFQDDYAASIRHTILKQGLQNSVYLYGSCSDVSNIVQQSAIGILTSVSEGLPVAVLEYGAEKLAVVCTNVGELAAIISHNQNGLLVPSNEVSAFFESLLIMIEKEQQRAEFGKNLFQKVQQDFSQKQILTQYLKWIETL